MNISSQENTPELEKRRSLKEEAQIATGKILSDLEESSSKFNFLENAPFKIRTSYEVKEGLSLSITQDVEPEELEDFMYDVLCFRDGLNTFMPPPIMGTSSFTKEIVASFLERPESELNHMVAFAFACSLGTGTLQEFEYCGITISVAEGDMPEDVLAAFKEEANDLIKMRDFRNGNKAAIGVITPDDPSA